MTTAIFPNNDDIRPIVRELIARIKSCERDFPIKVDSPLVSAEKLRGRRGGGGGLLARPGMVCVRKEWKS